MPMRIIFFASFLSIMYGMFAGCNMGEGDFVACDKTYIQYNQIDYFQNRFFIKIENAIVCTSALYSDEQGCYFKDYLTQNCDDGEWECSKCNTCNPDWYTLCRNCKRVNWKT